MLEIKIISQRAGNTYGKRRMLIELLDKGYQLGIYQTASFNEARASRRSQTPEETLLP